MFSFPISYRYTLNYMRSLLKYYINHTDFAKLAESVCFSSLKYESLRGKICCNFTISQENQWCSFLAWHNKGKYDKFCYTTNPTERSTSKIFRSTSEIVLESFVESQRVLAECSASNDWACLSSAHRAFGGILQTILKQFLSSSEKKVGRRALGGISGVWLLNLCHKLVPNLH